MWTPPGGPTRQAGRYGNYFRHRVGTARTDEAVGTGSNGHDATLFSRGGRWWLLVLLALALGVVLSVLLARAGERTRVDLFDAKGRRTGYAVVDRDTRRVDFYDTTSRRTGYGRVDHTGKVERFRLDGKREEHTVLPLAPGKERR